jgi:hypothetical protein
LSIKGSGKIILTDQFPLSLQSSSACIVLKARPSARLGILAW